MHLAAWLLLRLLSWIDWFARYCFAGIGSLAGCQTICVWGALFGILIYSVGCSQPQGSSAGELEARLEAVDVELQKLAYPSFRGGVGALGYSTPFFDEPDHSFWIEVDLGDEVWVDQVVLVPVLIRNREKSIRSNGFPEAFQVWAGVSEDREGIQIAEYSELKPSRLGTAPVVIDVLKTRASWVRIQIPKLTKMSLKEDAYGVQLSELFVFSGAKNMALRRPLSFSMRDTQLLARVSGSEYLVDGVLPYLMDKAEAVGTSAFVASPDSDVDTHRAVIQLDLGEERSFSEIRLHAIEQRDNIPQPYSSALGIPRSLLVQGANSADFSDAFSILNFSWQDVYELGPILMWNLPPTKCRFVRLIMEDRPHYGDLRASDDLMGFAEIELIEQGENVALGAEVSVDHVVRNPSRPAKVLTDGLNQYGRILPVRVWLEELAQRQQLLVERSELSRGLKYIYDAQELRLKWMGRLAIALTVLIVCILVISYFMRMRHDAQTRERIAANLHDELGANLHAIGILGDVAEESVGAPERLIETVRRIRTITERTGAATRICMSILGRNTLSEDLIAGMHGDARRLLVDIDYSIEIEGADFLAELKARTRMDLYLFYKEALINVVRHAGATRVSILLEASSGGFRLEIEDNGCGMTAGRVPDSLARRARLMRAHCKVEERGQGGTRVELSWKSRCWWRR